jgi:nucleotidyltransferase substrate binding protein (TIGR01987 family)
LKDSINQAAVDELDRDGTIQRFEFTFELFWKSLKALIVHEGFDCAGPRSCIKEGARRGFLQDGEMILDMLEDRNKTSHIYDEATAREIFDRIKQSYIKVIEENIRLFEQYIAKQA